jgi:hypothetical protein
MPYAPIVGPSDLATHIYPEVLDEITRYSGTGDNTIAITAIDQAIQQSKTFLTRYDLLQIFGDEVTDTAATFTPDSFLLDIIKTIAIWNIMSMNNANVYYESWKERYQMKVDSLKAIQKGTSDPRWPYFDTTGESAPASDQVTIIANPKRNNYY